MTEQQHRLRNFDPVTVSVFPLVIMVNAAADSFVGLFETSIRSDIIKLERVVLHAEIDVAFTTLSTLLAVLLLLFR
jgi:hypothetical protein